MDVVDILLRLITLWGGFFALAAIAIFSIAIGIAALVAPCLVIGAIMGWWVGGTVDKTRVICKFCKNDQFYEGPSGGACTNIMCADCGAKFNYCGVPQNMEILSGPSPQ